MLNMALFSLEVKRMWVENVNTGHKWHVSEERGKRLLKSDDYKQVEAEKSAPKRAKKSEVNEQSE